MIFSRVVLVFFILLSSHLHAIDVFLFVHGLGANQDQIYRLYTEFRQDGTANAHWFIPQGSTIALFDCPDALPEKDKYKAQFVNLGQQLDIDRLAMAYEETLHQIPDANIVLVGLSRGAATIINFVALHKPQHLKALILESPFDSYDSLIKHIMKRFHLEYLPFFIGKMIMHTRFPLIDFEGIMPLKTAHWLPKELPMIFIHSKEDSVVPFESSVILYDIVCKNGNNNASFLQLEHGAHGKLMHGLQAELYQNTVKEFLKKHLN